MATSSAILCHVSIQLATARGSSSQTAISPHTTSETTKVRRVGRINLFILPPSLQLLSYLPSLTRNMPTSAARRIWSSSQSIGSSAKVRVFGFPQNSPIRSARSKSGSKGTWSSSARGAGPRTSRRSRRGRSSSSGLMAGGYAGKRTRSADDLAKCDREGDEDGDGNQDEGHLPPVRIAWRLSETWVLHVVERRKHC
jgi:hypothetical protein